MHKSMFGRKSGDRRVQHVQMGSRVVATGHGCKAYDVKGLPVDVLEHVFHYLDKRDVVALSCTCKLLRDVASSPGSTVWSSLTRRAFLFEELPKDLDFLSSHNTPLIREQFWQLSRQRPAFLSDAPRTSEILEHTGSRFSKVLHIDGRRDFNFTTVFRDVPPGEYNVVWRLMLQPGYVRGYCNFRAVFSRPADPKTAASDKPQRRPRSNPATQMAATVKQMLLGTTTKPDPKATAVAGVAERGGWGLFRRLGSRSGSPATVAPPEEDLEEDGPFPDPEGVQLPEGRAHADLSTQPGRGSRSWRLRRRLGWRPACMSTAAASAGRRDNSSRSSSRACSSRSSVNSIRSGGGTSNGNLQHAATAPDASGAGPLRAGAPLRSLSASSAPPPQLLRKDQPADQQQPSQHPSQHQQPPQPQQQQLQVACAVHPQFPEIEPVMPLQLPPPSPSPMAAVNAFARLQQAPEALPPPPPQQPLLQRPSAVQRAAAELAAGPQARLQRAMGQLATASAKRDAAMAAGGGPRYVPRWLSPLWGGHACAWRQLDPTGPLGHGAWRSLQMGTLTVRRAADAHLHGVMVQLRPLNLQQQELALPSGERLWRGALVDYVELVPVRSSKLFGGLLPSFLRRRQRGSPVVPELSEIVEVPRL